MSYPDRAYLFENLFAIGSVNLLAGMSGGGKSRFSFQLTEEIEQKGLLLGMPSLFPINPIYFALDRTLASVHKTLNTMNCQLRAPLVSLFDKATAFDELRLPKPSELKGHNLAIIDGIDCLVPKLTDSREVGRLLFQCSKLAQASDAALLCILGTAKVKEGEGYAHPRERIIGSSFWGRLSEDIVLISASEEREDQNARVASILPRNAAETNINLTFQGGRLIREILAQPDPNELKLYDLLPDSFTTEEAKEAAATLQIPRSTFTRYITRLCNQRLLMRLGKGCYIKVAVN